MANIKTTITVFGKEYTIVSDSSREQVHRVALYLDEHMRELSSRYVNLSTLMLTTLTALNMTDEYLKAMDELTTLRKEVEEMQSAMRNLKIQQTVQQTEPDASELEEKLIKEKLQKLKSENERYKQQRIAKIN